MFMVFAIRLKILQQTYFAKNNNIKTPFHPKEFFSEKNEKGVYL